MTRARSRYSSVGAVAAATAVLLAAPANARPEEPATTGAGAASCRTVGHRAVVFLDPGHGANVTPTKATSGGSVGIYSGENGSGGHEDADVFDVAMRVRWHLQRAGYTVVLSRTSNPDAKRRTLWQKGNLAEKANSGRPADLAVSLHTDSRANIGAGQIYYDLQGGYRQNNGNSTRRVFNNSAVAARSKTFALKFKSSRTKWQKASVGVYAGHTFPSSRALGSHGTIPIVMLSAQHVPWVYNEFGRTTSSGLSTRDSGLYVASVVEGVKTSIGPLSGTGAAVVRCS